MYNLNSFFTFCYMSILHVVCLVFLTIFFSPNHLFKIKLQLLVLQSNALPLSYTPLTSSFWFSMEVATSP